MIQLPLTETELELVVIMNNQAVEAESDLTKLGAFFSLRHKAESLLEAERNADA